MTAHSKITNEAELCRARDWFEHNMVGDLSGEMLRNISETEGIDFATALIYEHIRRSEPHKSFVELMDADSQFAEGDCSTMPMVAVVPSGFYVEYPHTGGDGRLAREVAKKLGWRCEIIPVVSVGTLDENARIIREWLQRHRDKKLIIVSLCKGSGDVKLALRDYNCRNIIGWINVCGTFNGAAISEWALAKESRKLIFRLLYQWQGHDFQFLSGLRQQKDSPLTFDLPHLENMAFVNVVGFPMRRHLFTRYTRFCHRLLRPQGPNDGTILLADVLQWPGLVYPVWGADHYLQPAHSDMKCLFENIFRFVAQRSRTGVLA